MTKSVLLLVYFSWTNSRPILTVCHYYYMQLADDVFNLKLGTHYPCSRALCTGREHSPWTRVSKNDTVFTGHVGYRPTGGQDGPWTRESFLAHHGTCTWTRASFWTPAWPVGLWAGV